MWSKLASHEVQNLYQEKDVAPILLSLTDAVLTEPVELLTAAEASKLKVKIWDIEVEQYVLQLAQLKENKVILHTIIWEQCTRSLHIELKGTNGYETTKTANNCILLLTKTCGISLNYESTNRSISVLTMHWSSTSFSDKTWSPTMTISRLSSE